MSDRGNPARWDQSAALERLLACSRFEQVTSDVLDPLAALLQASSGVFVQFLGFPLQGDAVGRYGHTGVGRHAIEEYGDGLYTLDPMVQPALHWLHSDREAPATLVAQLSDIPGWQEQACYRKFLERFDIGDVLALAVSVRTVLGPQCMCLGFHRPKSGGSFSPGDLHRLSGFAPALAAVLSNLAYREAALLSGELLGTISESTDGLGYLVMDEDLRVRQASAEALRLLGLAGASSRFDPIASSILGNLRQHLMDAAPASGATWCFTLAREPRNSESPQSVMVKSRTTVGADGRPCHLLTLRYPNRHCGVSQACRQLDISERELEVVQLVCIGLPNVDIARDLGIAVRTVENHLRSIYAKVGVSSRTQLVARLLELH